MEILSKQKFDAPKQLTESEISQLERQDSRGLVSNFHQLKLEKESAKNWDKFYNRNGDRYVLVLV